MSAAILLILAMAWLVPAESSPNERRLPDGSILRIEGVTLGTRHTYNFGYAPRSRWFFWERKRQLLSAESGGSVVVVWMTRRDAETGRSLDFDWWNRSVVVDSLGGEVTD